MIMKRNGYPTKKMSWACWSSSSFSWCLISSTIEWADLQKITIFVTMLDATCWTQLVVAWIFFHLSVSYSLKKRDDEIHGQAKSKVFEPGWAQRTPALSYNFSFITKTPVPRVKPIAITSSWRKIFSKSQYISIRVHVTGVLLNNSLTGQVEEARLMYSLKLEVDHAEFQLNILWFVSFLHLTPNLLSLL